MIHGLKTILQNSFIVAALFLAWNPSHSQGYLEAGYKVGIWLNAGGMNSVLKEFNTKNPWQKFSMVHTAHGGRIMYGAEMDDITFFTGLDWIRTVKTSSGIDPATNQMSYRKLVVHNGGIGFGLNMKASDGVEFGFETNVFNYFAVRAFESAQPGFKSGTQYREFEAFYRVHPELNLFMRFSKWYGFTGIVVTPKIDLPFYGKNELINLAKEWKLNTSPERRMRGFNMSITVGLLLGKRRN